MFALLIIAFLSSYVMWGCGMVVSHISEDLHNLARSSGGWDRTNLSIWRLAKDGVRTQVKIEKDGFDLCPDTSQN